MVIEKNRDRSPYTFANINLLGKCNFDCRWCLGKDLPDFYKFNHLQTHFRNWLNLEKYLNLIQGADIKQIYITGQNCDSLQYKYLGELINYLQNLNFFVGARTNGLLALHKIETINKLDTCMGDAISYTVLTIDKEKHKKIVGHSLIPDWRRIFESTVVPMRVAIVIDNNNINEFFTTVNWLAQYKNIKYIQVRRICTDTRFEEFEKDIKLYDELESFVSKNYSLIKEYEKSKIYSIFSIPCSFWKTVATTANSFNYFTDGTISDEYFIIEGYLKNVNR